MNDLTASTDISLVPAWTDPTSMWDRHPLPADWQSLRQEAWNTAQQLGLPNRKTESFKYLNLKTLKDKPWVRSGIPVLSGAQREALRDLIRERALPGARLLVLVDGYLQTELSLCDGLAVQDLARLSPGSENELDQKRWILWRQKFRRDFGPHHFPQDYFDQLNQAHFDRGVAVHIPNESSGIVQILSVISGAGLWSPLQIYLDIGSRSSCQVYESHISLTGSSVAWAHPEIWARAGESCSLEWTQWQNLAAEDLFVGRSRLILEKGSQLKSLQIADGARLARHNVDFHIVGPGVSAQMNGITLAGPGQSLDFHTLIDHQVGQSQSTQLYKGILGSDAQAVFNGKVLIRFGAQKASSEQLNQNLLLSDRSEIDSKPELEVFADDVKATHGSAVGQINPEEVFYLQSRAIGAKEAREMLALGSVMGLLEDISHFELRERLRKAIRHSYQRLSQEAP